MYQGRFERDDPNAAIRPDSEIQMQEIPGFKAQEQPIIEAQEAPQFATLENLNVASQAKTDTTAQLEANTTPRRSPALNSTARRSATPAKRRRNSDKSQQHKKRQTKNRKTGTYVFYCTYAAFILLFLIALIFVLNPLEDWLVKFEASQPIHKQEQVFAEVFSDPDWKSLYAKAGIKDTAFENADSFAAYMDQKYGEKDLTCVETSAGLSGNKKYIVKCDDEKIATFLLISDKTSDTDIAEWTLGDIELFYSRNISVTVEKHPSHTVYINNVPLDDSYTIRKVSTLADKYLPEGFQGYHLEQQQVTGLMHTPDVVLKDEQGNTIPLTLDPDSGIYTIGTETNAASETEKNLAIAAAEARLKYMIGKATMTDIQALFERDSQIYTAIATSEVGWAQSGAAYDFTDPVFSSYYRYGDSLFSIKIDITLKQTRFDGSVKDYPLNSTFFFRKNESGKWLVMEATNIDVQQKTDLVCLTFMDGNTLVSTSFVEANTARLTLPQVTVPEGHTFKGWGTIKDDGNGNTTLTILFTPTETDEIFLPEGQTLNPMTLYAYFEKDGAE